MDEIEAELAREDEAAADFERPKAELIAKRSRPQVAGRFPLYTDTDVDDPGEGPQGRGMGALRGVEAYPEKSWPSSGFPTAAPSSAWSGGPATSIAA